MRSESAVLRTQAKLTLHITFDISGRKPPSILAIAPWLVHSLKVDVNIIRLDQSKATYLDPSVCTWYDRKCSAESEYNGGL